MSNKTCKCCGKTIEAEQILAAENCLWCFSHCTIIHEEEPKKNREIDSSECSFCGEVDFPGYHKAWCFNNADD